MGWTKRQFATQAFEEIGFGYPYNLQPDQLQSAMYKLDAMMAQWNARGIRLGYPLPSSPQSSNLDDDTNVPDQAIEAIFLNLAIRLAPSFGKTVSVELKQFAKEAYNTVIAKAAFPVPQQITNLPSGAGNKWWRDSFNPFLPEPEDTLDAGPDSALNFN